MKQKVLLQINVTSNWGSTGKIMEQIGLEAEANGWKCYVAFGRYFTSSKLATFKIGSKLDVYLHYLKNRFFDKEGQASNRGTIQLIKFIESIQPSLIQLHNIHDHFLNYPVLFRYLIEKNIPIVWTQHDCWAFTGHCYHFIGAKCEKWKTGCYACPLKYKLSLDCSKNNYDLKKHLFTSVPSLTLVTVSDWLGSVVSQSFFKNNPIQVIKNGVDLDIFHPSVSMITQQLGIVEKKVLLAVASAWTPLKGLDDYIKLSELLSDNYQIILVGLPNRIIKSLPKRIIGLERTNDVQQLVELYSAAEVVLNLSYAETFGLTTVEGFACGTPSIVYNCTSSPELIEDGVGYVVEPGDLGGVVRALSIISKNGKSYYSARCRERAVKYYNKKDRFKDYVNLYEKIINRS